MPTFPQEGRPFARYHVVRRIGRGGMGTVFEARQTDLDRSVALKVLSSAVAEDEEFRRRFVREALLLARLDSPHVITVYDAGEEDGQLWIATQLVAGHDLGRELAEHGPLPVVRALEVTRQVASALVDAHEAGLLHRDVKPANVLLRQIRGEDFAYLCDFGIARPVDLTETRTAAVLGTVSYMAPECHQGEVATVASDVYSLGCVLWAALTGRAPYERTNAFQLGVAHVSDPVPVLPGEGPTTGAVNAVLGRAMAKDPRDRYVSAAEMLADLGVASRVAAGVGDPAPLRPSDHTVLRAATRPETAARAAEPARPPRRTTVTVAWVVLAVLALAGVAYAGYTLLPLRADESPSAAAGSTATPTASARSASGSAARSAAPPTGPATSAGTTAATGDVECWNGRRARAAAACPDPTGRLGLRSVFGSLDSSCRAVSRAQVPGRVEVFECEYGAYMVRYERWARGADKYAYFDRANPGYRSGTFTLEGQFAGRTWTSYEGSPAEDKPWQRSAAYRYHPYAFSVEAVDEASRLAGVRRVAAQARVPSEIGLR